VATPERLGNRELGDRVLLSADCGDRLPHRAALHPRAWLEAGLLCELRSALHHVARRLQPGRVEFPDRFSVRGQPPGPSRSDPERDGVRPIGIRQPC
jgi:hypothetical protein